MLWYSKFSFQKQFNSFKTNCKKGQTSTNCLIVVLLENTQLLTQFFYLPFFLYILSKFLTWTNHLPIFPTGAQFGTVISMPLSGLLADSALKWPSIFYVFGTIGAIWSVAFLFMCYEDPEVHPRIDSEEKKYILSSLWGSAGVSVSSIEIIECFMFCLLLEQRCLFSSFFLICRVLQFLGNQLFHLCHSGQF